MRLLAHVHGYPPAHNAGAEHALHGLLRWLVARGHSATVYAERYVSPCTLDGVTVRGCAGFAEVERLYREADVVITHLDYTRKAVGYARAFRRPLVFWAHAPNHPHFYRVTPRDAALVIFNAATSQAGARTWRGPSRVLRPPIDRAVYAVEPLGDAVLLANLCAEKGAVTFYAAARELPNVRFLAVRGAYGDQIEPPADLANVWVFGPLTDMREAYRHARLVVMPSESETFGRVAMEAAASGIPAICAPTAGLRECMGDAAVYVAADDVPGYVAAIRELLKARAWRKASKAALARFDRFATELAGDLEAVEGDLVRLAEDVEQQRGRRA